MKKTALIISTYNWPEALNLCLKSVLIQKIFPDEIIIADDGSDERTQKLVKHVKEKFPVRVKHVWQEDRGFRLAKIRNRAIINSESDYLVFVDGDILLHPYFIYDHVKNRKPNFFITGSRVLLSEKETASRLNSENYLFKWLNYSAKNRINGIHNDFLSLLISKENKGIYNIRGCNMSFWKDDLVEVNGFDEQFEGWGREDSDVVLRLLSRGRKKLKLKFNAIQYHLFHNERNIHSLLENDKIIAETKSTQRIRAKIGLAECRIKDK